MLTFLKQTIGILLIILGSYGIFDEVDNKINSKFQVVEAKLETPYDMRSKYNRLVQSTVKVYTGVFDKEGALLYNITGSGWYIRPNYLVTNAHVVRKNREVNIELYNGKVIGGIVIHRDPEIDTAVVYTEGTNMIPVKFGDATKITVGQPVFSISSPHGERNTLGVGYVTGIQRVSKLPPYDDLFQVAVGVSPGSSGGAIFNYNNELVALIFAMWGGSAHGFAIPEYLIRYYVDSKILDHQINGNMDAAVEKTVPKPRRNWRTKWV